MRVAFFTAGNRGAGHRVRGIAIKRALERAGFSGEYRMFGPSHPFSADLDADWENVELDPALLASVADAPGTDLAARLAAYAPDVLIVDMFWAPLRHILPLPGCVCWLLLRACPPTWLDGPPTAKFDSMQYARIASIEPISSSVLTDRIDPIVVVNPDECQPPGTLRRKLAVGSADKLVGVAHAGSPGEHATLVPATQPGQVVARFDMFEPGALFPIAAWLGDCDEVRCGAGYNAYWEARWLGYSGRTTFTPFPRVNDDQAWRLMRGERYPMGANGADTVARWLLRGG